MMTGQYPAEQVDEAFSTRDHSSGPVIAQSSGRGLLFRVSWYTYGQAHFTDGVLGE